jgi:hypothetical protein
MSKNFPRGFLDSLINEQISIIDTMIHTNHTKPLFDYRAKHNSLLAEIYTPSLDVKSLYGEEFLAIECENPLPNMIIQPTNPLFGCEEKQKPLLPEIYTPSPKVEFLYGGEPLDELLNEAILTR